MTVREEAFVGNTRRLLDYIGVDPDADPAETEAQGAPFCVVLALRDLRVREQEMADQPETTA